jgi:hypothetical protein
VLEYQHMALHLRVGSSLPEHTLPRSNRHSDSAPVGEKNIKGDCGGDYMHVSGRQNIIHEPPSPPSDGKECTVLYSSLSSKVNANP